MTPSPLRRPVSRSAAAVVLALVLVLLSGSAGSSPAARAAPTPEAAGQVVTIDGPVPLDAAWYAPAGPVPEGGWPAVVVAHGFGGSRADVAGRARRLADEGFLTVAFSARGFGASGGEITLDGEDIAADIAAVTDWLADRPDVRRDGPGDPRVGLVGASYGGGGSLLAAAADGRVDAVVAVSAWHSLVTSLAPSAAADGEGVWKRLWAGLLFAAGGAPPGEAAGEGGAADAGEGGATGPVGAGGVGDAPVPAGVCGRFSAELCAAYTDVATTGVLTASGRRLLSAADIDAAAVSAPTLLLHGRADTLFPLSEAAANAAGLAESPAAGRHRARWGTGAHGAPLPEETTTDLVRDWFTRWLDGSDAAGAAGADGAATDAAGADGAALVWDDGMELRTRTELVPRTEGRELPLRGGGIAVNPPGGTPAAVSSLPGAGAVGDLLPSTELPGQQVSFTSDPLEAGLVVLGAPRTTVRVTSETGAAQIFAKVYDVAADGTTRLVGAQVAPARVDELPRDVPLTLPYLAHTFAAGHRFRVVLATTDQAYDNRTTPDRYGLEAAALTVPVAPADAPASGAASPDAAPSRGVSAAVVALLLAGVLAVLLIVLGARWWRRRRTPHPDPDPDPDSAPDPHPEAGAGAAGPTAPVVTDGPSVVVVDDLRKRYPGGLVAVDGASFTVGRGQVFGLLGPNGAGKTTTLRMVLGLMRPTSGHVELLGERMRPSHPVLARVGTLVEGPGFVPQLSGLENLRAWWESGPRRHGRAPRLVDAGLARALDVADLGTALHRPVRSYSHGMRQRLAIAQALLGEPELLVLDEPSDGLDPGQIRRLRVLLAELARNGATVLVSSHLLSEVEQMCTHAAVMRDGRVLASGSITDLVAGGASVSLRVGDPARARVVLTSVLGDGRVRAEADVLVVDRDGHRPSDLVRALVDAGVPVEAVSPDRRLEDAFLDLVGGSDVPPREEGGR